MQLVARALTLAALGIAFMGASGCAAAAAGAKAPEEAEPTTVEEAQAQLDRSRADIESAMGPQGGTPGAAGAATPSQPSAPPTPSLTQAAPLTSPPPPPAEALSSESQSSSGASACVTACRAIASMRRAVSAICRMAGSQDARCVDARKTLSDDEARVAPCGC